MFSDDSNIVLIGMPGVGKSTLGVLLAKTSGRAFLDTDVLLQSQHGRRLQEILDREGAERFREIEEATICALDCRHTVIATGGSVVYSRKAMLHLRASGQLVHLILGLDDLRRRLANFGDRGVLRSPGQTLESLYAERMPLYRQYADLQIDCGQRSHEQIVDEIQGKFAAGLLDANRRHW
jgi:shikimate kinase